MASIISTKTSGGGGIAVTGDTSGVMQLASNDGTTAVTIDASQNVGIGTASPSANFEIYGASSPYQITGNGTQQTFLGVDGGGGFAGTLSNHSFFLRTNNTNQVGVTSAGLFQFNSGYGSVATAYGCRAWVNFNGTGTVAIRASGNVSSITDNGTGNYTVNFTNAMPNANYTTVATCSSDTDGFLKVVALNSRSGSSVDPTTTAQRIYTRVSGTNSDSDTAWVEVSVFR